MKVVVAVDFSDASLNAAEFAARMLQGRYGAIMLFYHVYHNAAEELQIKTSGTRLLPVISKT